MSLSVPYTCAVCGKLNHVMPYPSEAEPVEIGGTFTIEIGCSNLCRPLNVVKIRKIDGLNFEPVTDATPVLKQQPKDRLSDFVVTPQGKIEKIETPNLFDKPI